MNFSKFLYSQLSHVQATSECVGVTPMDAQQVSLSLNIITGVLLIISELLGLSKCQANGIIDLLIANLKCLQRQVEVSPDPKETMMEPVHQDRIVVS